VVRRLGGRHELGRSEQRLLDGETRTPASTAALQDVAASARGHAGAKTMLAEPGNSLWLPGPFHRTLLRYVRSALSIRVAFALNNASCHQMQDPAHHALPGFGIVAMPVSRVPALAGNGGTNSGVCCVLDSAHRRLPTPNPSANPVGNRR
jgi:hypothetical protein